METNTHKIPIAGRWTLEDLYVFPRAYEQCYFMYLAFRPNIRWIDDDRILHAYEVFPWQGGYSAVDFYNQLKWAVPRRKRPHVTRIRYSSPGLIELGGLVVAVATLVDQAVRRLCDTTKTLSKTYSDVYRDMQKRKLLRIKTENQIRRLTRTDRVVIDAHVARIADALNVDAATLNERTGSPYKSLKILLSLFRRVRVLSEFQDKGKLRLK